MIFTNTYFVEELSKAVAFQKTKSKYICLSNSTDSAPAEQVWVDNKEAPARVKNLTGKVLLRCRCAYA